VGVEYLPVLVGEDRRARTVEDGRAPGPEARGAGRLDTHEPDTCVVDESGEEPDRVRAAADTRDDRVRQPVICLEHLCACLVADHCLQLSHYARVRRRADARADEVVRRLDVRDPVTNRLARRLLQRLRAELDGTDLRAEEPHAFDVRMLAPDVLGAHVDDALEAEASAHRRRRDPVLAGAGLGDDAPLAEPRASRIWPSALLILCAPVWFRSSRLRTMRRPGGANRCVS
jgi:hypothetical protein